MARRTVTVVGSDGKDEDISWYEGASESAVLRCARLALGIITKHPPVHLVWKNGDIVDFGKPISDGITLYLDTVTANKDAFLEQKSNGLYSSSSAGGVGYQHHEGQLKRRPSGNSSSNNSAHHRSPDGSAEYNNSSDNDKGNGPENFKEVSFPSADCRGRSGGVGGLMRNVKSTLLALQGDGVDGDGARKGSRKNNAEPDSNEEERLPLLHESSLQTGRVNGRKGKGKGVGGRGGGSVGAWESGGNETNEDENNAKHQRRSILKVKRVLAHLANERTFLAWVRAMGKLFTAGALSFALASSSSSSFGVFFLVLSLVYFALCPYVVFIGATRYYKVHEIMSGSAHETYLFFSGNLVKGLTVLMSLLASITIVLMVAEFLAEY